MKDYTKKLTESGEIVWKSINIPPSEDGFYVVAHFDGGTLKYVEADFVSINGSGLRPNGLYSSIYQYGGPTHYISTKDYYRLLEMLLKIDKITGEIYV